MIDWLKVRIPIPHSTLDNGRLIRLTPDGEIEWEMGTWGKVQGSHDSSLRIKTYNLDELQIDGNFVKFLQGHNVWGTNDLQGLIAELLDYLQPLLGTRFNFNELLSFADASILSRIDCTESHVVRSYKEAQSAIRVLEQCGRLRHRGNGQMFADSTVYWGKKSRRWALKMYHKGAELRAHKLHPELPFRRSISLYADKVVRSEFVFRQLELKDTGFDRVSKWDENTVRELHAEYIQRLEISGQVEMTESKIEELPSRLRLAYISWCNGEDMKKVLTKRTFYRYCAELKKLDIDISIPRKVKKKKAVVDLREVITLEPASVPEWAEGTPAYFEPRIRA